MKTKEALDRAAERLRNGDHPEEVLDGLERDLPQGKVKNYLKETGSMLDDILKKFEEVVKKYKAPEEAVNELKELQKLLAELKKKLDEAPETMPEEITGYLKAQISALINIVDFVVMLGSVAEVLRAEVLSKVGGVSSPKPPKI